MALARSPSSRRRCSPVRSRSSRVTWPRKEPIHRRTRSARCMCEERMLSLPEMRVPSDSNPAYWIDRLDDDQDLDGVLFVESESFTNPWTKDMYAWELQNRAVCHIFVVRTSDQPVVGFCAFWLVVDEIHINNVAILPRLRGRGIGTGLMQRVFDEARGLGAARATLEVRASNLGARRLY